MGRESDDAKDERQRRAGRWLRGQRDDRRLSQKDVAERLGIAQQTYSRYEKGHLAIPHEFVPELAAMLELDETAVWRSLEIPLPGPFRTDDEVIAYARRRWPRSMAAGMQEEPGPNPRNPGVSRSPRPRSGESVAKTPQGEQPAV